MKVSIIIPYREDRGYLAEAIESARHQQFFTLNRDYEIIVQQGNYGLSKNVNDAIEKAKGDFIKILAEDDKLDPTCLHHLYNHAVDNNCDLVCADAINFDEKEMSSVVFKSFLPATVADLAYDNLIHGGTVLYRLSAMPRWEESQWTAEEYELHFRMALAGAKFGYVPRVVYYYRIHAAQKSAHYWNLDPMTQETRRDYVQNLQQKYMWDQTKINQ